MSMPEPGSYQAMSAAAHRDTVQTFKNGVGESEGLCMCLAIMIHKGYYKRFYEPVKERWVEHPTIAAYITCTTPF